MKCPSCSRSQPEESFTKLNSKTPYKSCSICRQKSLDRNKQNKFKNLPDLQELVLIDVPDIDSILNTGSNTVYNTNNNTDKTQDNTDNNKEITGKSWKKFIIPVVLGVIGLSLFQTPSMQVPEFPTYV